MKKIKFNKSTVINVLLLATFLVVLFNADAKAGIMSGLIQVGLFKPDLDDVPPPQIHSDAGVRFQDGEGKVVSLSDLKGKVVFINFWATWCPPCRAEMPSVNKLYSRFADDKNVVFLIVDADGDYPKAKRFLQRRKLELPLYTVAGDMPRELFSGSLPTTVVIDKKGTIVFRHEGMADYMDTKFTTFFAGLAK